MGKRKSKKVKVSRAQVINKRRGKLEKEFLCYYCQHEKSVSVKVDKRDATGYLACRICGIKFITKVTLLDEPIDVYTIWMDTCREGEQMQASNKIADEPMHHLPRSPKHREQLNAVAKAAKSTVQDRDRGPGTSGPAVTSAENSQEGPKTGILKRPRREELPPTSFSAIAGSKRSKRIIDALDESPDEPEFTVDTLTGDNLFDDD